MITKQKRSPYWYAVIYHGGKHHWYNTKCEVKLKDSKKDAQAIHDELIERMRKKERQERVAVLLGERIPEQHPLLLSKTWQKYCEVNPSWSEGGFKIFKHFCEWHSTDVDISLINADIALKFMAQYRDSAVKTFNTYKSAMSIIWRTLKPYTDITENPWETIVNRTGESGFYRPITESEYKAILKATTGWWHDATVIAWYTGLRRKDIMLLKWEEVQGDCIMDLIPAKTSHSGKAVGFYLHDKALAVIRKQKHTSEFVFPAVCKRLRSGSFEREYGEILDRLEITAERPAEVGFHSLRTAFISRCKKLGISTEIIQGVVGHGSPEMTGHYNHDISATKILKKLK
jgi:integrase